MTVLFLFSAFAGSFNSPGNGAHTAERHIQSSTASTGIADTHNFFPGFPSSKSLTERGSTSGGSSQTYKVTFVADNLSAGNSWQLWIYNHSSNDTPFMCLLLHISTGLVYRNSSTSTSMIANLPAGEYNLFAGPGTSIIKNMTFNVTSSTNTVSVPLPKYYAITIQVSSPPPGGAWNAIAMNSTSNFFDLNNTTSSSIVMYLSNASYSLFVGPISSFWFAQNITVSGSSQTYTVSFPHFQKIAISENNLPPGQSWLFAAQNKSSTFHYINATTSPSMTAYIPLGTYNYTVSSGEIFISHEFNVTSSTTSITVNFPMNYKITFAESGLQSGTSWNITAYNHNHSVYYYNSTTGTSMIAFLPNGTYNYSADANGVRETHEFNVTGSPVSISIKFPTFYKVTFAETGLPSGQSWGIAAGNHDYSVNYNNATTGTSMIAFLPNGTYNYSADANGVRETHEFNVTGSPVSISIKFPTFYKVTFTETGLPSGMSWIINVYGESVSLSNKTSGGTITEYLPNGTYTCKFGPDGSTVEKHPLQVAGAPLSVSLVFPTLYAVTFTASGLRAGAEWSIYIDNSNGSLVYQNHTSGSSMLEYLPAWTLNYSAREVSVTVTHEFTVIGTSAFTVTFPELYVITFTQSGLKSGQTWTLSVSNSNGTVYYSNSTSGTSMIAYIPNGTYTFNAIAGSVSISKSFSFSAGTPSSLAIVFAKVFEVTFTETNAPPGAEWTIHAYNSNGTVNYYNSTTGTSMIAYIPNGTYNYTASVDNAVAIHEFSVTGAPLSLNVIFPTQYAITFTQSGVPSAISWTLHVYTWNFTVSNYYTSEGSSTIVYLPNGTYNYTAQVDVQGSVTIPATEFKVTAAPATINLKFPRFWYVNFIRSGIASGTTWVVDFNGSSASTTGSMISFAEMNGTNYPYTVNSVSGYNVTPSTGQQTVNGANVSISVKYTAINYKVTFTETGLLSGYWYLNLTGNSENGTAFSRLSGPLSTGGSYSFYLPFGSYVYNVSTTNKAYVPKSYSTQLQVSGTSAIQVVFMLPYSVIFTETGLASGTSWTVTLNGTSNTSTGTSIGFEVPNGTSYSYTVSPVAGYSASPSSGTFPISGSGKTITVTFTPIQKTQQKYDVTFTESGLPSGTSWTVTFNGSSNTSTGTSIGFEVPNGTSYSYTVSPVAGYSASPSSGTFPISGSGKIISVTFTPVTKTATKYSVTFTETGLPSGTSWYVILNGTNESSTSSTITFQVVNGTYSFTVGKVGNYITSPASGSINVKGSNVSKSITFSQPAQPISLITFVAIGAVVAIVVVALIVFLKRRK
ncbi:MAG: hypothetical protein M1151_07680 [Candidatus Thermoplasmatota archaeon]|nr:hypothetical protein [Candidatus Thermoplasmatota archaeon]